VPVHQTLHLPFPSPIVFAPKNGQTCASVGIGTTGGITVTVNGFVN
jgi:hypothetical protein